MSHWPLVALGEVIDFFDAKRVPLSGMERVSRRGEFPYYGASGVIDWIDGFIFDGTYLLIAEDGENLNSRKSPLAFFANGRFWVNNHAHVIRSKPGVLDDAFLQQWFAQADIGGYITGAAQPKLSQANLKRIQFPLPPLTAQRKIAAILSAYDHLIENNNRRIKLLDEIAQRIYREWFVDFRYPGHESVPLVPSGLGLIPQGWVNGRWGQYATLDYGRALRGYKDSTGSYPVFGTNGQIGRNDEALFPAGVIVGRKGAYRGIHLSRDPCWVIDTAFYLRIGYSPIDSMYAYHQLRTVDLDEIDSGSAIPSTSRDAFYAIPITVPPAPLLQRFASFAWDLDALQRTLTKGAQVLRKTRDLLLPRLLSGEVDVAELDIAMPKVAA